MSNVIKFSDIDLSKLKLVCEDGYKICPGCKKQKYLSFFGGDKTTADGKTVYCKNCKKDYMRAWRSRETTNWKERAKKGHLKQRFGLTIESFNILLESQNFKCAICSCELDIENNSRDVCIDHSHITSRIRGILCRKCNSGLGAFKDSLSVIEKAMQYIRTKGE